MSQMIDPEYEARLAFCMECNAPSGYPCQRVIWVTGDFGDLIPMTEERTFHSKRWKSYRKHGGQFFTLRELQRREMERQTSVEKADKS